MSWETVKEEGKSFNSWRRDYSGSATKDENSWAKGGGSRSWGSSSWGPEAKNDSSNAWGAKRDSWAGAAKEDWDNKGTWGGQKRSWGEDSGGEVKRARWWEDPKEQTTPVKTQTGTPIKEESGALTPVDNGFVPQTPFGASRLPGAPRTPAAAFSPRGVAPFTPGMAPTTPAGAAMTPGFGAARVGMHAPQTPMGAAMTPGQRNIPSTPRDAFVPSTPGPGMAGAASNRSIPATPRDAFMPSTPGPAMAGARSIPATPRDAFMPSTPGPAMAGARSIPATPRDAFMPSTPGPAMAGSASNRSIPSTPRDAFVPRTPGPAAFTPAGVAAGVTPRSAPFTPFAAGTMGRNIPSTPRDAFVPMTPGVLGGGFRPAPTTPANALHRPGYGTPAGFGGASGSMMAAPTTPSGAWQRQGPDVGAPRTPNAPGTPTGVPGTPATFGGRMPGTPAELARMALPMHGQASPSTPAGLLRRTGQANGSAGLTRPGMTPARIINPQTPVGIMRGGIVHEHVPNPMSMEMQAFGETRLSIFSDGTDAPLRHAPRRKRSTGEKLPIPSLPATIPESWTNKVLVAAGTNEKPKVTEDPIPNFAAWRKNRRKDKAKIVSVRDASGAQVPHVPHTGLAPQAASPKPEEETPAPAGEETPAGGGETPGLPPDQTPRMPGVETPGFGAETPIRMLLGGEETPRVPHTPADGEVWSKGETTPMHGLGDQTPRVVPTCPPRSDLKHKTTAKVEEATPVLAAETPQPGDQTPMGAETPLMPPEALGMETPLMPPPRAGPPLGAVDGPATPPRGGGSASATVDITPALDSTRRPSGGSNVQAFSKPGTAYL